MSTHQFKLSIKHPFSLRLTAESHGWAQLAPWHWDGKQLERLSRVKTRKTWIRVQQPSKKKLLVETSSTNEDEVTRLITRWLQLDWDPTAFLKLCEANDPAIAELIRAGGGRFLRADTFYEDLIKTICTINTTWKQTQNMVANMVALRRGAFPTPREMLKIGPEQLASECKLGFRAKTVDNVTSQLLNDKIIRADGSAPDGSVGYDYLVSLKGIGPYAAAHTMVLCRDFSALPVDSEVSAYLRGQGQDPARAQQLFEHWGDYRFLGYKLKRIAEKDNWIGD